MREFAEALKSRPRPTPNLNIKLTSRLSRRLFGTLLAISLLILSDIGVLQGSKLSSLNLGATKVTDLSALKGVPLTELHIFKTQVKDLAPLAGSPLKTLIAFECPNLQDLKPLEKCKELEGVVLPANYGDIEFLRKMPKLKFLTAAPRAETWWLQQQAAAAFWSVNPQKRSQPTGGLK